MIRGVRNPETYKRQSRFWKAVCLLSSRDWLFRRHFAYSIPGSWRPVRAMLLLLTLVINWRCLDAEGLLSTFGEMLWNAKILIAIFLFMGFLPYQYWDRSQRAKSRLDKKSISPERFCKWQPRRAYSAGRRHGRTIEQRSVSRTPEGNSHILEAE